MPRIVFDGVKVMRQLEPVKEALSKAQSTCTNASNELTSLYNNNQVTWMKSLATSFEGVASTCVELSKTTNSIIDACYELQRNVDKASEETV